MLRKGRFDEIFVGLPTQEERQAILRFIYPDYDPITKSYDLDRLAYETLIFSGAEIEQTLINAH